MRELICKYKVIKNDDRGFAFTTLFFLLLPFLLAIILNGPQITRTKRVVNETLQEAISYAVVDAAHMVNEESQALGNPLIDYEKAYERFMDSLEHNLSLNKSKPTEISSLEGDLTYWLLIYNGKSFQGHKGGKVSSYAYYTNESGELRLITDELINGFPKVVNISEDGFVGEAGIKVSMDSPSVVAIVRTNIHSIMGKGEKVTRWSMGKIVKR